ncbi:MAG: hypothetical protein EBT03_07780 [Betaproteobacteria bacterium]|nr:hypothetical protein [Betaproteobacteria bacterium]
MLERRMRVLFGAAADRTRWQRLRHAQRAARVMLEQHTLLSIEDQPTRAEIPSKMIVSAEWVSHGLTTILVVLAIVASSSFDGMLQTPLPASLDAAGDRDDPRVVTREMTSSPLALPIHVLLLLLKSVLAFVVGVLVRESLRLMASGDGRLSFLGAMFTVLTVFAFVAWFAVAGACALAVVGDTANGCDQLS